METNKIYQGDCLELMKDIEAESIDLVITDPPYKLTQKYGNYIDSDNLMAVASIINSLKQIDRVLKRGRYAVIFYDNRILPFLFEAIKGTNLRYKRQLFLYRRWGTAHKTFKWMGCTDPVIIFQKGDEKPFNPEDIGQIKHDCYIKASPEKETFGHPAQKPIEICEDIVLAFSNKGEIILDPYCGSGSILEASKNKQRNFIGMELSEEYCKIANERLSKLNNGNDGIPPKPKDLGILPNFI